MSDLIDREKAIAERFHLFINGSAVEVVQVETLMGLPSIQPSLYGYNLEHLELIARLLQKENLTPDSVKEALTNISRIASIIKDEYEETIRKAVKWYGKEEI